MWEVFFLREPQYHLQPLMWGFSRSLSSYCFSLFLPSWAQVAILIKEKILWTGLSGAFKKHPLCFSCLFDPFLSAVKFCLRIFPWKYNLYTLLPFKSHPYEAHAIGLCFPCPRAFVLVFVSTHFGHPAWLSLHMDDPRRTLSLCPFPSPLSPNVPSHTWACNCSTAKPYVALLCLPVPWLTFYEDI